MIATFLDDIFKELENKGIEVTLYARSTKEGLYEVKVTLGYSVSISTWGQPRISVDGVGPTFRDAINNAYDQLRGLIDALEAKPEEPPEWAIRATASDDDIPF